MKFALQRIWKIDIYKSQPSLKFIFISPLYVKCLKIFYATLICLEQNKNSEEHFVSRVSSLMRNSPKFRFNIIVKTNIKLMVIWHETSITQSLSVVFASNGLLKCFLKHHSLNSEDIGGLMINGWKTSRLRYFMLQFLPRKRQDSTLEITGHFFILHL